MKIIIFVGFLILITAKNLRNTADWNWNTVQTKLLNLHNTLRKKHKSPSLTKTAQVTKFAQQATDHCAKIGKPEHTTHSYKNTVISQNIYVSSWAPSADDVIQGWYYEEEPHYDYAKGKSKDGGETGHFTAMIWKSTKEIGCAYTYGKWRSTNGYYVACEYYPTGNSPGEFTKNIVKPSS